MFPHDGRLAGWQHLCLHAGNAQGGADGARGAPGVPGQQVTLVALASGQRGRENATKGGGGREGLYWGGPAGGPGLDEGIRSRGRWERSMGHRLRSSVLCIQHTPFPCQAARQGQSPRRPGCVQSAARTARCSAATAAGARVWRSPPPPRPLGARSWRIRSSKSPRHPFALCIPNTRGVSYVFDPARRKRGVHGVR